jgi:hypothetical protein
MERARPRLTYANVVSTLALFLVLGTGAAFAAKKLATTDIKPGAIKTKLLARKAVKSGKIAPRAVKRRHIASNAVGASQLAPDSVDGTEVRDGSLTPADLLGGASVVATAEGSLAAVKSSDLKEPDPVPLNGGSWIQGAKQSNLFLARVDSTLTRTLEHSCNLEVVLYSNGVLIGTVRTASSSPTPTPVSKEALLDGVNVAPGAAVQRQLSAAAYSPADSGSPCAAASVDSLKVVVLGVG